MFNIKTYNNISQEGLSRLPGDRYIISADHDEPDAIILRSAKLHDMRVPENLMAVGRAGAGTNNVPVADMSARGIPVFNAPGANANAVKELVVAGMLLACRNLIDAWRYTSEIEGTPEEQSKAVEDGKKKFVGFELPGKTLGVIGLGAIGVQIANAASALGMRVIGFDPTITVKSAWQLSSDVEEMSSVEELMKQSDFLTFHVPLIEETKNLLNAERIAMLPEGAVILNFAREGIVNDDAVIAAIELGMIRYYVSDFPSQKLKGHSRVIALPHLGASTAEAEDNCAIMVADQLKDFLENGNIKNSVNFPNIKLTRVGDCRLAIANKNMPDMVGQISHILGKASANILHMRNDSRNDLAYTLIDLETAIDDTVMNQILSVEGVLNARQL